MKGKKKLTAAVAVVTALVLLLGGTFAWQSISQTALNEKEAVINPGGRLHDDFDGSNKDVYVENFAEDEIFARVRLDEYFEITMNKGTAAEKTEVVTTGAIKENKASYIPHTFTDNDATSGYWDWATGGTTMYMPTFNKNKDSLVADINGTMGYTDASGNKKPYGDYVDYSKSENTPKESTEIYDGDSNSNDEVGTDFNNLQTYEDAGNIKTVAGQEHHAKSTGDCKGLISMADWQALNNEVYSEVTHANYWVYDVDGWCYWSSPIQAGTATGLLLDGISLVDKMDDSYYYAINVVGQFITADDLGNANDGTGFYADKDQLPTEDALDLLEKIGVDVDGEIADTDDKDNGDTDTDEIPSKLIYSAYVFNGQDQEEIYEMVIFSVDRGTEMTTAKAAEIIEVEINKIQHLEMKTAESSGSATTETYSRNVNSVRFANEVQPLSMEKYFYNVGKNIGGTVSFNFTNLDTSKVKNMASAFSGCAATSLDLSSFDTSNVTDMSYMFENCEKLTSITIGANWKTSKVTDMTSMFSGCSQLTLDCSEWDISKVNAHEGFSDNAGSVTEPNW